SHGARHVLHSFPTRRSSDLSLSASFEKLCLAAGLEALGDMMARDAQAACGPRHARSEARRAHRWGKTTGKIGFHGGKVAIERPRDRKSTRLNSSHDQSSYAV